MTENTSAYAQAGVDTAAGDLAVELMKEAVSRTHGPEVLGGFGGFGRQQPIREKGRDIYLNVDVSLSDIFNEKEIEVKYNKNNPCHFCGGT